MQELGQILSKTAGITDQKVIEHVFKLADTQQKGLLSYDQFLEIIRHWKQKVFSILFGVILWSVEDLSIFFLWNLSFSGMFDGRLQKGFFETRCLSIFLHCVW